MTASSGELSPARVGAEVLLEVARRRFEGALHWTRSDGAVELAFKAGRPVLASEGGRVASARSDVVLSVRMFACASRGTFLFADKSIGASTLGIDTLGEALVAVVTALTEAQLTAVWQARRDLAVAPNSEFETLRAAVARVKGPSVEVPRDGTTLVDLALGLPLPAQRALAALLFLGGLSTKPIATPPAARAPLEPRARAEASEIEATWARFQEQSHYDVLGVARNAGAEQIRTAYLQLASRWHSDRFAGIELGPAAAKLAEVFRRLADAERILTDPEQRRGYDFVLERHAQGLPTEAGVILEAEALFKKAQGLVRRGQAAAALQLLQRAVELNKGEPEYWAYLGFSLYSARGKAALAEARGYLEQSLEMRARLDAAHEFLGRIARIEGETDEARKRFRRALEINPKNLEAERELRLLTMRGGKTKPEARSLTDLLGGILKRTKK